MTPTSTLQPPPSNLQRLWHVLTAVSIFLLAFGAVAWRLNRAPDVFTDEILYTRAGIRVAAERALVWDNGEPLLVHPPLYFLVEGAYLALTAEVSATDPGDVFAWVYHARYLNAFLAGLTAVLLYGIGRRLRGVGLGLLLAALFILDPFGVRINRRAMLETMAALLSLAGMALVLTARERIRPRRAVAAGLLLGVGLLTKELTFTAPLAVLLLGLWELWRSKSSASPPLRPSACPEHRRRAPLHIFLAVAIAGFTYGLFPLWALTAGRWDRFAHVKVLSLRRLLGLVRISGWNRPGVSLWDFLLRRLTDYGTSYLLLALGGMAALGLLIAHRHKRAGRLLGVWGAVLYPLYAFVTLVGSGNDQFFYFLLLPAVLLVGYAVTVSPRPSFIVYCSLFILLILPYNAARWWTAYGVGVDDGYRQLAAYVEEHLPPGEPLNASGDAIKYRYFFPDRPIAEAATPGEAQAAGVRYFALAPRDAQARYGRTTPELAAWLRAEGVLLFAVEGDSYGSIFLYRMDYPWNGHRLRGIPGPSRRPRQALCSRSWEASPDGDFPSTTLRTSSLWRALPQVP